MSLNPNISVYQPEPGVQPADFSTHGVMKVPNETVAGRSYIRRPTGSPWNAFTNWPWAVGANAVGWMKVSEDDNDTPFRIALFEHSGNN